MELPFYYIAFFRDFNRSGPLFTECLRFVDFIRWRKSPLGKCVEL